MIITSKILNSDIIIDFRGFINSKLIIELESLIYSLVNVFSLRGKGRYPVS